MANINLELVHRFYNETRKLNITYLSNYPYHQAVEALNNEYVFFVVSPMNQQMVTNAFMASAKKIGTTISLSFETVNHSEDNRVYQMFWVTVLFS